MQEATGFQKQTPSSGNCAQRALVHALLLLGMPISLSAAHRQTGIPKSAAKERGTSEKYLLRGISRCNCIGYAFDFSTHPEAREEIESFLEQGLPVIINSEKGTHWIVLAGKHSLDEFYWIDSADADLCGISAWTDIRKWMEFDGSYYLIGIRPKDDDQLVHSIVNRFDKVYTSVGNGELATNWGTYLEDLLEVFDCPATEPAVVDAHTFFELGPQIVEAVDYYYGKADIRTLKKLMLYYQTVAELHQLTMSPSKKDVSLIKFTVAFGVQALYQ